MTAMHDDVIKWKHFRVTGHLCGEFTGPRWIPRTKWWHGALMFSFICGWINDWVNNRDAGDLRRHRGHYDVIVMGKSRQEMNVWTHNIQPIAHPRGKLWAVGLGVLKKSDRVITGFGCISFVWVYVNYACVESYRCYLKHSSLMCDINILNLYFLCNISLIIFVCSVT